MCITGFITLAEKARVSMMVKYGMLRCRQQAPSTTDDNQQNVADNDDDQVCLCVCCRCVFDIVN